MAASFGPLDPASASYLARIIAHREDRGLPTSWSSPKQPNEPTTMALALRKAMEEAKRKSGWTFKGTDVWRLGWDEMKEVYSGFTIGNKGRSEQLV